jgi:hypothetical protein
MAEVSNPNAAVVAGNGLGPKTMIFSVDTGELTVAAAIDLATTAYGMTVAAVEGTADGSHIACQGANTNGSQGLEGVTGVALVATFDQNPV